MKTDGSSDFVVGAPPRKVPSHAVDGLEREVASIYTPLELVASELRKRWRDRQLERRIAEFLKDDIPAVLRDRPAAISTAHVATPNYWTLEFATMSREYGLPSVMFEWLDDMFVTTNPDKAALAKMRLLAGVNCHGRIWVGRHIIDLTGGQERKRLSSLRTLWDESFVEFHHRLTMTRLPWAKMYDGSAWYERNGTGPGTRYLATMVVALRNAVLFENFLTSRREAEFTRSHVIPAFHEITHRFGVRPLIVFISPSQKEEDRVWWSYPKEILPLVPDHRQGPLAACRTSALRQG